MDGASDFYGIRLSENMTETPEGYLICHNAVIGRTGVQTYRFSQLPQEEAAELGIHAGPDDLIDLHRDEEDVFDPEFIRSLEGKPVTDLHPPQLLTLDTVEEHKRGHMQNVRPGDEALDTGDMPLLADLYITNKNLIAKIRAGLRELSCGYTFHIARDGNRILQVDMTGNHVAVLHNGRAGREARIQDAADSQETIPMKFKEWLRQQAAKYLGEHGATAAPEDIRAAAVALDAAEPQQQQQRQERQPARNERQQQQRRTRAQQAMDADREAAHSLIDSMYDAREEAEGAESAAEDEARADLMDMLACANDEDDIEGEEEGMDGDPNAEEEEAAQEEEEAEVEDAAEPRNGYEPIIPVNDRAKPAAPGLDRADRGGQRTRRPQRPAMDGEELLRALRPSIARSKDRKVRAAFDAALKKLRPAAGSGVRRNGAGYTRFTQAAAAAHDEAVIEMSPDKLNEAYAKSRQAKRDRYVKK